MGLNDWPMRRKEPQGFPGLALRISYGGRRSWVFFYRIGGRLRRMTLGTYPAVSLAEARQAWREARTEAQTGRDPSRAGKNEKPATDFKNVGRGIIDSNPLADLPKPGAESARDRVLSDEEL